jgi:hypothetical protein
LGINDVKQYNKEKYGEDLDENENKVQTNNGMLVFNNTENGLRKNEKNMTSFGEYKKEKEIMEFDTFKGTQKQSSSGRGLSEFTINKTVSNLDPKQESKGVISSIDHRTSQKTVQDSRKVMSQENKNNKVGIFTKIKNKMFGSASKKEKSDDNDESKSSQFESKPIKEKPQNDYAIDFFDKKMDIKEEQKIEQVKSDKEEDQMTQQEVDKKVDEEKITETPQKEENKNSNKPSDSMIEITKPNDISIINLTKNSDKKKKEVFQSPSKVLKEMEKGKKSSKKKSTGKDMSFTAWGKNSINALKRNLN